MIIYGSRMYGKSEKVSAWGICLIVINMPGMRATTEENGDMSILLIIPAGKKVRVMNECSSCDMGSHVPLDEIEA